MTSYNTWSTPLDISSILSAINCTLLSNDTHYCYLVGAPQYLTFTRHDIAYTIHIYVSSCITHVSLILSSQNTNFDTLKVPFTITFVPHHHAVINSFLIRMLIGCILNHVDRLSVTTYTSMITYNFSLECRSRVVAKASWLHNLLLELHVLVTTTI